MNATVAQVPSGPDQLSNAWLTAALRGAGAIGESAVSSHSWKAVERPGAADIVVRIRRRGTRVSSSARWEGRRTPERNRPMRA